MLRRFDREPTILIWVIGIFKATRCSTTSIPVEAETMGCKAPRRMVREENRSYNL